VELLQNTFATSFVSKIAPTGNPFPKPFATQHKSAEIPEFSNSRIPKSPKKNSE